jgi:poly-gamma-glutamate system protein
MKKMYWQAHNIPRYLMILMCLVALIGMWVVEHYKSLKPQPYYQEKLEAAQLAGTAMEAIKKRRLALGFKIDREHDPQNSGLIGKHMTVVTSDHGKLLSKRTAINPNIAALVVGWMKEAGLEKGDYVAVGMTGSFPSLDICVLAALKVLGLKPLVVLSGGASQWGANLPGFLWIDMEHYLRRQKIFDTKPIGASIGGSQDRGKNMPKEGAAIIRNTIHSLGIHFIDSKSTEDGIVQRMALYRKAAGAKPISMYVNVGGGAASIGIRVDKSSHLDPEKVRPERLDSGYVSSLPIRSANTDSVSVRFLKQGAPVINLHEIDHIAKKYELPTSPKIQPFVGSGLIFFHYQYNKLLACIVLGVVMLMLLLLTVVSRRFVVKYQQS